MADIISNIAKIKIARKHIDGPQGVRGRNSDNTLLEEITNWNPKITLEEGLRQTYNWIEEQVKIKHEFPMFTTQFNSLKKEPSR